MKQNFDKLNCESYSHCSHDGETKHTSVRYVNLDNISFMRDITDEDYKRKDPPSKSMKTYIKMTCGAEFYTDAG